MLLAHLSPITLYHIFRTLSTIIILIGFKKLIRVTVWRNLSAIPRNSSYWIKRLRFYFICFVFSWIQYSKWNHFCQIWNYYFNAPMFFSSPRLSRFGLCGFECFGHVIFKQNLKLTLSPFLCFYCPEPCSTSRGAKTILLFIPWKFLFTFLVFALHILYCY